MMLNDITEAAGRHKRRKRVGRGESGGQGKTCGRGHKGCLSRSGGGPHPLSEGGQMPIFRRLPKRGFSNFNFRTEMQVVNLTSLERVFSDGDKVDPAKLAEARLIDDPKGLVKVLGLGDLGKKLTIAAHAFSKQAKERIEKAGGTATLLDNKPASEKAKAKRNTAKKSAGAAKKAQKPAPTQAVESPTDSEQEQS